LEVCSLEQHHLEFATEGAIARAQILIAWFKANSSEELIRIALLCEFGGKSYCPEEPTVEAMCVHAVCRSCQRVFECAFVNERIIPWQCSGCKTNFYSNNYFQPVVKRKPDVDF